MPHNFITLAKNAKDITNQRFGRLVALGPVAKTEQGVMWLCNCDCGQECIVNGKKLRNEHTRSCGCLRGELSAIISTTHGMTKEPVYNVWNVMIQRCTNPNDAGYSYYGGRGITVCDEWLNSFESYYTHVSQLPNHGVKGYSLDRIDNSLGYQPGNVRYATRGEQSRNKRSNIMLTHNGKTQVLTDWADELQIGRGTLQWRFHKGWSIERALTTPLREAKPRQ